MTKRKDEETENEHVRILEETTLDVGRGRVRTLKPGKVVSLARATAAVLVDSGAAEYYKGDVGTASEAAG